MLAVGLLFWPADNSAWRHPLRADTTQPGPESERLLNQPLTSDAARKRIDALLDQPPFQHRETVTRWRWAMAKRPSDRAPWHACSNACCRAVRCGKAERLAQIPEVLLWTLLASVVAIV